MLDITIWNVSPMYCKGDTLKYVVLPYSLRGTLTLYMGNKNLKDLFAFLKRSKLNKYKAQLFANKLNMQKDICN